MPIDPVLKKKWERVFRVFFDQNNNKVLDWNDFELLFEKIKTLRGEKSTEFTVAQEKMYTVWQGLLCETKGYSLTDDPEPGVEISVEEWDAMWSRFNPRTMPVWMWEYLKFMFLLLDSSGDKYIDKEEYTTVMGIYNISPEDAAAAFDGFAKDDKGRHLYKIDYGKFVKLWGDYFTSTDINKPANSLFGP